MRFNIVFLIIQLFNTHNKFSYLNFEFTISNIEDIVFSTRLKTDSRHCFLIPFKNKTRIIIVNKKIYTFQVGLSTN